VAAEDAPSNTESGEALTPAQNAAEEPEAMAVESVSQTAPVAEKAESEDEPLVSGPVGEILEESDEGSDASAANDAAQSVTAEAAEETEPSEQPVSQADTAGEEPAVDDEPMLGGHVGEILDESNVGSVPVPADEPDATSDASSDTVATAEGAKPSESKETSGEGGRSNVRILSVGQQVEGTVKRIAEFGAFVDIGVGRDGLIHISELSVLRVGKETDVLSEGQVVTGGVKKLDRDRNRISLTLIDPNTKTIRDLNKDDLVQGTVTRILPYGAFVDIGIGRDALLHVREMGVGYVAKPEDVVKVGDTIEARIIELSRRRGRVDLSLKGLREEPEPTPPPMPEPAQPQPQPSSSRRRQEPEPEPEYEDEEDLEDLEVLSPMELAFKRAMEAEGVELNISRKKQSKRNRRERNRSLQDEIIARTLSSGRK
jgi:predicted RNA-binding protein with RPS1 domain